MLAIRLTIWATLCLYAFAALVLLRRGDRRVHPWLWTLAWLAFVLHVAAAFHYFHGWSHSHAVEHVRRASGVGEGLYVSYLFTLVWTLDVAWLLLRPRSYAVRPLWMGWALHGFMLFMIVNATIVFESGVSRWLGVVIVEVLARQGVYLLHQPRRA